MAVSWDELQDMILEAERLMLEGVDETDAADLDALLAKMRAAEPENPQVGAALSQLEHMRAEQADPLLPALADKTLDNVDRDSWDYLGEDAVPTPADRAEEERKRKLKAYAKRQRS